MITTVIQSAISEVAKPSAAIDCENGICSVDAGFLANLRAKAEAQAKVVLEAAVQDCEKIED